MGVLRRRISSRQIISAALIAVAVLASASVLLYNVLPELGYTIVPTSISPTATYTGQMGVSLHGTYRYVTAVPRCRQNPIPCSNPDETVFYLETNTTVVRLIFYCGVVPNYCTSPDQLPFSEGAVIFVKGTLIEPSKWPTTQFEPSKAFAADLYVFDYKTYSI